MVVLPGIGASEGAANFVDDEVPVLVLGRLDKGEEVVIGLLDRIFVIQ